MSKKIASILAMTAAIAGPSMLDYREVQTSSYSPKSKKLQGYKMWHFDVANGRLLVVYCLDLCNYVEHSKSTLTNLDTIEVELKMYRHWATKARSYETALDNFIKYAKKHLNFSKSQIKALKA